MRARKLKRKKCMKTKIRGNFGVNLARELDFYMKDQVDDDILIVRRGRAIRGISL